MSKTPILNTTIKPVPVGKSNLFERPVSAVLEKFKANPINNPYILKDKFEAPKMAGPTVVC